MKCFSGKLAEDILWVAYSPLLSSCWTEMEGEQESKTSLMGFVKRILAMVPFPSVLKTWVVNKSWWARLSSTSSQANKVKKHGEDVEIVSGEDDRVNTQGREAVSITLPEDLVERILAMLPFPCVFKARALSKSWLANFSPVESQSDEVKKQSAISFQKQWSSNWKPLYPVFKNTNPVESGREIEFIVYDRASSSWSRMLSLPLIRRIEQIDGPCTLLLGSTDGDIEKEAKVWEQVWMNSVTKPRQKLAKFVREDRMPRMGIGRRLRRPRAFMEHNLYVGNFLTGMCKELPFPFQWDPEEYYDETYNGLGMLVSETLLGTYKVIAFCLQSASGQVKYNVKVYDSKSNAWRSCTTLINGTSLATRGPAYLQGVFYMWLQENPRYLVALNVEERTFKELEISGDMTGGGVVLGLVVSNDNLLMIVSESYFCNLVKVLKIDLELLTSLEVAQGPPDALNFSITGILDGHSNHGDCIYFYSSYGEDRVQKGMVVYNVPKDEWSHIYFPGSSGSATYEYIGLSFSPT